MDGSDNIVDFSYEWVKRNLDEIEEYINEGGEKVVIGFYEGMKVRLTYGE